MKNRNNSNIHILYSYQFCLKKKEKPADKPFNFSTNLNKVLVSKFAFMKLKI